MKMRNFWICALLLVATAYGDHVPAYGDYDDYYYGSLEELDKIIKDNEEPIPKTDIEDDLKVEEEIQEFRKAEGNAADDNIDSIVDYQFEDNRDKDDQNLNENDNIKAVNDEGQPQDGNENRPEEYNRNADYALLWGDDSIAPLPVPDDSNIGANDAIIEETHKILEEIGADKFDDEFNPEIVGLDDKEQTTEETKLAAIEVDNNDENKKLEEVGNFDDDVKNEFGNLDITEETQKILEEVDNKNLTEEPKVDEEEVKVNDEEDELMEDLRKILEEGDFKDAVIESEDNQESDLKKLTEVDHKEQQNNVKETVNEASEEDTVDKAYDDLNADLEKLFETLDKLKDDGSESKEKIKEMEKEFDNLFEEWDTAEIDNMDGSDEFDEGPVDFDKVLQDIREENNMNQDKVPAEEIGLDNDELSEPNPDDDQEKDVENIDFDLGRIIFGNDALVNSEEKDAKSIENNDNIELNTENSENINQNVATTVQTESKPKTALVDELNSAELDDLVSQFSILHSEDLDVHADTFIEKSTAPIQITLKVDEPTIITSPDYPSPYPTNNIVDWVLTGQGEGIELNITEFAVNGALGDYLLIKPGGVDDSGHDGLLFTYRLTSEPRYRFTDVDRLFMRFEAKLGMMFFRGFSISAKMIAPLRDIQEEIPEPEPVVTPPHSTITVHLASTVPQFELVREQFRMLLANMATEYIRENEVDPGLNSTSEVTQITSAHLCPVSWPNFQSCVAVTFGVSLVYEEEDLRLNEEDLNSMWFQYAYQEPFITELEKLGLSEFIKPDSAALTAWLVIAGGVVIAMVLLAGLLWRYSCFEDYTRMKAYSDTDSITNEKRGLDLYPTPHQTLPPLYGESEYKWPEDDTRVDMGGFPNKSYATDNMYDFESDEDVIPPRDRNGASNPKDISKV